MVLTHVAFDARGRGLGIFFCYQLIHLWKEQTKTNQMPGWNALWLQKPRKKMGLLHESFPREPDRGHWNVVWPEGREACLHKFLSSDWIGVDSPSKSRVTTSVFVRAFQSHLLVDEIEWAVDRIGQLIEIEAQMKTRNYRCGGEGR